MRRDVLCFLVLKSQRCLSRSVLIVVVVISLCAVPLRAMSDSVRLHDIPLPPNARIETVSANILQHGHRLSMAALLPASQPEVVLEFYRELWSHSDTVLPGYIEEETADWHIISSIEDGWNRVVQIRNSQQGIEAYISVMEIKPVADHAYVADMPRDGVLVSSLSGEEFNKPTQTDVVFSRQREGAVAGFYRNHFNSNGWSIVSDRKVEASIVLLMQRDGAQAEVVVSSVRDGSVAVVNKVGDSE